MLGRSPYLNAVVTLYTNCVLIETDVCLPTA